MKIQWEYDLVERPFCEQLKAMGWQWIEGDTDVPDFTERANFREVLLMGRLATALRKLNLRDGQPWLDDDRIRRIIEKLERADGHRLMEINESTTILLLKGTEIVGLSDWNFGRNQPVRFIDFENPANNDFLVINQFKVELTSGRGHVIPDAVLFVNGIPLGVAEFKSPGIENPLQEAINQLLRYSNQRRELWPTLYTDHEGVERLFHTNQLLIASNFFESRAATIGAPPEAYLEWTDIMHELVHLVEGHHGPEFWQALGRAMPDWQKRKDALADKAKDYLVFGLPSGRAASRLGAAGEK